MLISLLLSTAIYFLQIKCIARSSLSSQRGHGGIGIAGFGIVRSVLYLMGYARAYTLEDSFTISSIFIIGGTLIRMNLGNINEKGNA